MNILELADPLWQYTCSLLRSAEFGNVASYDQVRRDVPRIMREIADKAATDVRLSRQWARIELPLLFFADGVISRSKLPFAADWHLHRLAYERQEMAGDDKFFHLLEDCLRENTDDAPDRLAVFYVCLCLGFGGVYVSHPGKIRDYLSQIYPRIRHLTEGSSGERFCEDAYVVDARTLHIPPSSSLGLVLALFTFLIFAVLATYCALYLAASDSLRAALEVVRANATEFIMRH